MVAMRREENIHAMSLTVTVGLVRHLFLALVPPNKLPLLFSEVKRTGQIYFVGAYNECQTPAVPAAIENPNRHYGPPNAAVVNPLFL